MFGVIVSNSSDSSSSSSGSSGGSSSSSSGVSSRNNNSYRMNRDIPNTVSTTRRLISLTALNIDIFY